MEQDDYESNAERVTDFAQYRATFKQELIEEGLDNDTLLQMAGEGIQTIRQTMPTYQKVQDQMRYGMTLEDLEEVERKHSQLENDHTGAFEHEDFVDNVVESAAIMKVINTVLDRFTEGNQGYLSNIKAQQAQRSGSGCAVTVFALIAATSSLGVTAWLLAGHL